MLANMKIYIYICIYTYIHIYIYIRDGKKPGGTRSFYIFINNSRSKQKNPRHAFVDIGR